MIALLLSTCSSMAQAPLWATPTVETTITAAPYSIASACTNTFRKIPLEHIVKLPEPVTLFASNGSGVATGDVNSDGLIDIALANIAGDTTLALNRGALQFDEIGLNLPNTRAIQIVDIDGDGLLDISATHRNAGLSILKNMGGDAVPTFQKIAHTIRTISTYSMVWHDFNGDGLLDVVTGSYDAEVLRGGSQSLFDHHHRGVFYHEQQADGTFVTTQLTTEANALAITALDVNTDGVDDIVVGNDFDLRDAVWLNLGNEWVHHEPFVSTPHSTMSYDIGDLNRDGQPELFAADMNPYQIDVVTMASWLPVTSNMNQFHPADDPQLMENAMLQRQQNGRWRTIGRAVATTATGWSWSSRLNDFDNDGWVDLYVVNGMIAQELFPFLPGYALIEQNQALRFDGQRFVPMPSWQLDDTMSGRGMATADFDNDGDMDIVVNNLQSASIVYENQLCGGNSIQLDLRQGGTNPFAVGAQVRVITDAGTDWQTVLLGRGYLSGATTRLHIGLGERTIQAIDIRWPDGQTSRIDSLTPNTMYTILRGIP
jgi:enediyne biosynthesis protein E4